VSKIAVVTGAGGGLGQAIVAALLEQDIQVVGLDTNAAAMARIGDHRFFAVPCDVTDPEQVTLVFSQVQSDYGGLDILVNNAGTCDMSEFPQITPDALERQMQVNFHSAFHCAQAAVKLMKGRPNVCKIVNISSNGAYNFDVFDPPHYRASKAAMDALTKDLARRYAKDRIAVNSIAPAMTETPLFDVVSPDVLEAAISQMPQGRAMQPSEVAAWVAFLVSAAGDICSGNVIILNQGRDVR